jgi:hypothetical protein
VPGTSSAKVAAELRPVIASGRYALRTRLPSILNMNEGLRRQPDNHGARQEEHDTSETLTRTPFLLP